jgi:hypothetical protein
MAFRPPDYYLIPSNGVTYDNHSAQQSWSVQRDEANTFRFEVRPGDVWTLSDSAAKERAELSQRAVLDPAADIWVSHALRVEPGGTYPGGFVVLGQFHNSPDPNELSPSPLFAYTFDGGVLRVDLRTSTENPLVANPPPIIVYTDAAFPVGRWVRFVAQLRVDPAGSGFVKVWRDGAQIVNYSGPLGYVDAAGPYWKFGIYRAATSGTMVVRYANVEVSASSLSPRISNPCAIPYD